MNLGAFSASLSVKDLKASKQFYENLGFHAFAGDHEKSYFIMKNGNALIGIFHGMFENTMLTFNPGWDKNANPLDDFDDIRAIQKTLKEKNIELINDVDESGEGPGRFMVSDPDGNVILIDQHR